MLCINGYPQVFIDDCRARVEAQLAAYKKLVTAGQTAHYDKPLDAAIQAFEPEFFNSLVLQLDYLFVHRSRVMEKKDGNPLNEVRMLANSLLENNGKLMADKSIRLDPSKSILKYRVGDEIKLNEADFRRLFEAYFAEVETKFLQPEPLPT